MSGRRYTTEKVAHTLVTLEGHRGRLKPTAAVEDLSRQTVRRWAAGDTPPQVDKDELAVAVAQTRLRMSALFREVAVGAAEKVRDLLPEVRSARDAAIVMGIATEKYQLVTGQATERVEQVSLGDFLSKMRTPDEEEKTG